MVYQTGYAFDGKRKGPFFSVGIGYNDSNLNTKTGGSSTKENLNGLASIFRAGYGFNEELLLYIERKDGFFYQTIGTNSVLWDSALTGIGLTYFFLKDGSSPYFTVAYGYGQQFALKETGFNKYHGTAYKAGIGYQRSNSAIEFAAVRKELSSGNTYITTDTFLVTFHILMF